MSATSAERVPVLALVLARQRRLVRAALNAARAEALRDARRLAATSRPRHAAERLMDAAACGALLESLAAVEPPVP
jgi:hypothetical protein